jgi:hypothetical protein
LAVRHSHYSLPFQLSSLRQSGNSMGVLWERDRTGVRCLGACINYTNIEIFRGYGMTDANPLLCVRCTPSAFAVSRMGVLGAEHPRRCPNELGQNNPKLFLHVA